MAYVPEQQSNTGSYVQTTNVWDVSRLYELDVTSPEFKELLVRLYQNINNISVALNAKVSAYYLTEEFVNGKLFFNPVSSNQLDLRASFTKVVNIGTLGAGAIAVNHGLAVTNTWKWTYIGGAATNTTTLVGYPISFAGAAGNNIEVRVSSTQVLLNNASGVVFTDCYIILEYLKS